MIDRVLNLPDENNVYAVLTAHGLKKVERAAKRAVGSDAVSVYRSGFDGAAYLRSKLSIPYFD